MSEAKEVFAFAGRQRWPDMLPAEIFFVLLASSLMPPDAPWDEQLFLQMALVCNRWRILLWTYRFVTFHHDTRIPPNVQLWWLTKKNPKLQQLIHDYKEMQQLVLHSNLSNLDQPDTDSPLAYFRMHNRWKDHLRLNPKSSKVALLWVQLSSSLDAAASMSSLSSSSVDGDRIQTLLAALNIHSRQIIHHVCVMQLFIHAAKIDGILNGKEFCGFMTTLQAYLDKPHHRPEAEALSRVLWPHRTPGQAYASWNWDAAKAKLDEALCAMRQVDFASTCSNITDEALLAFLSWTFRVNMWKFSIGDVYCFLSPQGFISYVNNSIATFVPCANDSTTVCVPFSDPRRAQLMQAFPIQPEDIVLVHLASSDSYYHIAHGSGRFNEQSPRPFLINNQFRVDPFPPIPTQRVVAAAPSLLLINHSSVLHHAGNKHARASSSVVPSFEKKVCLGQGEDFADVVPLANQHGTHRISTTTRCVIADLSTPSIHKCTLPTAAPTPPGSLLFASHSHRLSFTSSFERATVLTPTRLS
jgi:hypothetical protein